MIFRRAIPRFVFSSLLAIAFLVQFALPAFSQPAYGVMSCCKRSKANCCCHGDKPGVVKIKAKTGCQGACRFGSLLAPSDAALLTSSPSSPRIQLVTTAREVARRLAVVNGRFDFTRFQRPPPVSL